MSEVPKIVLPHGGYNSLIVYKKSDLVYEGTVLFCRRFLPARGDRTVDQMTQAVANLMLTLCHQTRYLLDKMIARQEEDFKKFGGVRERMHAVRTAARGESWDKAVYSRLDAAASAAELAARAAEIKQSVDQAVWSLKKRKGWR